MTEVYDTSSGRDVREKTRKVKNAHEQFAFDLDVVLKTTEGRRMLWFLLQGSDQVGSGVMEDPFVAGQPDLTAYRSGLQARNKMLMTYMLAPERFHLYAQMVEEMSTPIPKR